jgi:sugar lactone lactonase YvrE
MISSRRLRLCSRRLFWIGLLGTLSAASTLLAVDTKYWEQAGELDFQKGRLTKLALSSDGHVSVSPAVKEIFDASTTFLWAVAHDSKGNIYAGGGSVGGSKSKLITVDPNGKSKVLAELDGMAIQAVAVDTQDRVYAATSPDGKVYRVDAAGKADVFYDPKTKYIWGLAFTSKGDLMVATGDQGEIQRVTPAGASSVFYRTEEAHVRSITIDSKDNIIAGTDPSGLVIRIAPDGTGFILYEAPKREITTLVVAGDGSIYAASTGSKQAAAAPPAAAPARQVQTSQGTITLTVPQGRPTNAPAPVTGGVATTAVAGGSDVYRIQPDGYARRVWTNTTDVVYSLALDSQGKVIAGTGNKGDVYRLEGENTYTKLLSVAPAQVTGLTTLSNGRVYAVTGNIGEIFLIGPEREASGVLESDVYDAGAFSYWGRLTSLVKNGGKQNVVFETRSGNTSRPQKDWSPWGKLNGERIASPAARFLQYRATISGTAELYDVASAYEMKNVAPVIEEIEVTQANYKFPAPAAVPTSITTPAATLTLPNLGRKTASSSTGTTTTPDAGSSPALTYSKGAIGARWLVNDENGDTLQFKLEIRGETETTWKPLRDNLRERFYGWDSTAFPDGKYFVRVTVSDAASNTPDQALSSTRESERFLIDNTAPEITGLTGTPAQGGKVEIRFHAKDAWNVLDRALYSINGGEWKIVEPTTRLTDSEEHDYRVTVDRAPGEMVVAVRVSDVYDNEAMAKTVLK